MNRTRERRNERTNERTTNRLNDNITFNFDRLDLIVVSPDKRMQHLIANGWMGGCIYVLYGLTDGWMDGWMDERTD